MALTLPGLLQTFFLIVATHVWKTQKNMHCKVPPLHVASTSWHVCVIHVSFSPILGCFLSMCQKSWLEAGKKKSQYSGLQCPLTNRPRPKSQAILLMSPLMSLITDRSVKGFPLPCCSSSLCSSPVRFPSHKAVWLVFGYFLPKDCLLLDLFILFRLH